MLPKACLPEQAGGTSPEVDFLLIGRNKNGIVIYLSTTSSGVRQEKFPLLPAIATFSLVPL